MILHKVMQVRKPMITNPIWIISLRTDMISYTIFTYNLLQLCNVKV